MIEAAAGRAAAAGGQVTTVVIQNIGFRVPPITKNISCYWQFLAAKSSPIIHIGGGGGWGFRSTTLLILFCILDHFYILVI